MVSMLEHECNKLGLELQKEKHDNIKLRMEVTELRKNIQFLNIKLEGVFKNHEALSKNNDFGKMEKEQVKEELTKMRTILKRK